MAFEPLFADSSQMESGMSPIREFFADKTVLVTGATGFIGGVLLERLLSSCPRLCQVIVLARPRYGYTSAARLRALLSQPLFDKVSEDAKRKVSMVKGDINAPAVGLCLSDLLRIKESVQIVFHLAADVNFTSSLDRAVSFNLGGTSAVLALARGMRHLQAFIYVSTAYCNCTVKNNIVEKVYPGPWDPVEFHQAVKRLPSEFFRGITKGFLKDHPNAHTFSKRLAENLIADLGEDLPIAIVRPSIVVSTAGRPLKGWTGKMGKGPFDFMAGPSEEANAIADLVPCDYLASFLIATAWRTATRCNSLQVYHFTSGTVSPISWSEFISYVKDHTFNLVTQKAQPSDIMDVPSKRVMGIEDILNRIERSYNSYAFLNHSSFDTRNTMSLWEEMSHEDRREFWFSMEHFDWDDYIKNCILSVRRDFTNLDLSQFMPRPNTTRRNVCYYSSLIVLSYAIASAVNFRTYEFVLCLFFVLLLNWL